MTTLSVELQIALVHLVYTLTEGVWNPADIFHEARRLRGMIEKEKDNETVSSGTGE